MYDVNAFERQVADEALRMAGPSEPVDDAAIFSAITATQSPKWRFGSVLSSAKFVVAGAIVALFGGFLLAGILGVQPDETGPASLTPSAEPYVVPTELPADLESGVLDTPVGPARWVRVTDAPANPALMGAVATEDGFAVLDHWSNRPWRSPDLLSWTELPLPTEVESAGLLDRTGGSYWLDGGAGGEVALWRSSDLDDWEPIDTAALSPGGPEGLIRPAWLGRRVEIGGSVLVPVQYHFWPDLVAYLGLPPDPGGESYDDSHGGWVFEPVEPGVYRVLTTSSDVDTMPLIRFEETPDGLRVLDAVDGSVLRELPGIDRRSMETLLAAFAEKVTGPSSDMRRDERLHEWAVGHGIASSHLASVEGNRLVPLAGTERSDARLLELFEAGDDLVLLEFRDDGRVGVRHSRDGMAWTPSVLAGDAAGATIEASSWHVGADVIELDVADGRVLRSSDGTTWEESRQPSVNRTDSLETGGFAEALSGRRMGGMVAKLAVDDGVAQTLLLYRADGERIDVDLRPLGIGTSFDDGEDDGFGTVISDRTVALSFGSPPRRGIGEYVILSFDELAE